MNFFTSPEDLSEWVKNQKPDNAAKKIIGIIGTNNEQDIVQTCRAMENDENASKVLFNILARHNITREGKMTNKIIKEAQIMRQPGEYSAMDLRVCPKLPSSMGKQLISTYNCRHYCLDSMVFDDDPKRVYCAEALWRRHVMDKFSREFKDKDGKWVGGYINERFQTFKDDGGNQMQLAHGERTRKPRPHQYSTERRLQEARGEEVTDFLTASNSKIVKIAKTKENEVVDETYNIFNDMIEMKEAGLNDEDIIFKISEHYGKTIVAAADIYKKATSMLERHNGVVYSCDNSKVIKTAFAQLPEKTTLINTKELSVTGKDGGNIILEINTPSVKVSPNLFYIVDGPDSGKTFSLVNPSDEISGFNVLDEKDANIQDAAEELGLNDSEIQNVNQEEFPINEL